MMVTDIGADNGSIDDDVDVDRGVDASDYYGADGGEYADDVVDDYYDCGDCDDDGAAGCGYVG